MPKSILDDEEILARRDRNAFDGGFQAGVECHAEIRAELLEALKGALHGLQTAQTYLYENGMTCGAVEQAHRRAFAAISKAEGK